MAETVVKERDWCGPTGLSLQLQTYFLVLISICTRYPLRPELRVEDAFPEARYVQRSP
jgi:hypothetical protein